MTGVHVIERCDFDGLLAALARRGYTIVGPRVRDQAIVYDEITSAEDLPIGWTDEQDGGHYRLRRRDDEALFGYAVGPHSWKQYQLPANVTLWRARVDQDGGLSEVTEPPRESSRLAFLGARSCELHAIGILDSVLLGSAHSEPADGARTEDVFIIAVQCAQAGGTCFCVSMHTGPVAERGFDLALTEILDGAIHRFVVEVGSERGADVLGEVPHRAAADVDLDASEAVHARTAAEMGRELMSICGDPDEPERLVHTVRALGLATQAVCAVEPGQAREIALATVRWAGELPFPDVRREPELVALAEPGRYPIDLGRIVSDRGLDIAPAEFDTHVVEEHVAHSNALHARLRERGSYLTGPLARYNLAFAQLWPLARDAARGAGLGETCRNPFQSIIVRAVELVQACDEALEIIDAYEPPTSPRWRLHRAAPSGTAPPRRPAACSTNATRSTTTGRSSTRGSSRRPRRTSSSSSRTCARSCSKTSNCPTRN